MKALSALKAEPITNLRFADDIDGLAGEEEELAKFVERLDKALKAYGMEISAEKAKLMTSIKEIKVNGQNLETVTNLRFADNSDCLAGEEEELAKLVEPLDNASTAYGTEISAETVSYTHLTLPTTAEV